MSHIGDALQPDPAGDACRACGSGDRAEAHYVASPLTGIPVTCTDDWHDEDAAEPGAPRAAAEDDHEPTLANIPPVDGWDLTRQLPASGPAPAAEDPDRQPAIGCGTCGETFAHAGFGGKALFLAEALHAAAVTAGWTVEAGEPSGTWTCTVCQAKAGAAPQPEPQAVTADPPPDTDPYRQYQDAFTEIDAREDKFWLDVNPSNTAAEERTHDRIRDSYCNIAHLLAADFCDGDPEKEEEIRRGMWDMSAKYQRRADETMQMRAVA